MQIAQSVRTMGRLFGASVAAALGRTRKLPPGFCWPFEQGMFRDQLFILKRAARLGPIFKVIWSKHLMICIVGNDLGRRFLKTHEAALQGASIDLSKLFLPGIIRNMDGQPHHDCKQSLVRIFHKDIVAANEGSLRSCITSSLGKFSKLARKDQTADALKSMLRNVVLDCMIVLFFGTDQDSPEFEVLRSNYLKFGPKDIVWKIGQNQTEAFGVIRACVDKLFSGSRQNSSDCFFGEALKLQQTSEPVIGNMIYMVEMGRYDISGLLRWVLKYLGENQNFVGEIRSLQTSDEINEMIDAAVLETLRLNQSAALVRKTKTEIEFEGMTLPAHSYIRVCLWEAHKNSVNFPQPFEFHPHRLLEAMPSPDKFAPFGLDIHRCLGTDIVMAIARLFVAELISSTDFSTSADGPAVLAQTIWEPSHLFAVEVTMKSG